MSSWIKFLIGFAAALLTGWLSHGPLGRGEAFADRLEARAKRVVAATQVAGVEVRIPRDPISRTARLSGPADRFQREGQGSFPGIDSRVKAIEGIAGVEWTNPPPR